MLSGAKSTTALNDQKTMTEKDCASYSMHEFLYLNEFLISKHAKSGVANSYTALLLPH